MPKEERPVPCKHVSTDGGGREQLRGVQRGVGSRLAAPCAGALKKVHARNTEDQKNEAIILDSLQGEDGAVKCSTARKQRIGTKDQVEKSEDRLYITSWGGTLRVRKGSTSGTISATGVPRREVDFKIA